MSRPTLTYPFWHQRKTAGDRLGIGDLSLITPGPLNLMARGARARSSSTEIERADAPFGMLAAAPEAGEELSTPSTPLTKADQIPLRATSTWFGRLNRPDRSGLYLDKAMVS